MSQIQPTQYSGITDELRLSSLTILTSLKRLEQHIDGTFNAAVPQFGTSNNISQGLSASDSVEAVTEISQSWNDVAVPCISCAFFAKNLGLTFSRSAPDLRKQ